MSMYLWLKLLHILAAVVVAGTGAGIAFFMFMVARSNNVQAIAVTARHVVLADWCFTTPAVITQFVTGVLLMRMLGWSFTSTWFIWVFSLFVFVGLCWLPVVWIQYRLRAHASEAVNTGEISAGFRKYMRWWTALGVPAFLAVLVIFWLMVTKPFAVI